MCPSEGKSPARRKTGDRGYVTAEAALVIPALVLFAALLVWALMAAAAQIRCVDAARAGARAVSRSEPAEVAEEAAPPGARVEVERVGDLWRVRVAAPAPGPGGLPVRLGAQAVALAEDSVGPPP
ncbi:TadE family type IV pilus minor pilin [Streptomyces sp. NPDC002120]|uniref:TadE family type IV pilus minor pilin n=1 Tax=Streptomyces sp. NPDC002120 TaxID=3364631 RepID=UPI00368945D0